MKLLFSIFLLNVLFVRGVQSAPLCADYFREGELTSEVRSALLHASSNGYKIEILRGYPGGRQKTLVLMGETHYKNKNDAEAGERVLRLMPFRALEGFDETAYKFPQVFRILSRLVLGSVAKWAQKDGLTETSTLHLAVDHEKQQQLNPINSGPRIVNIPLEVGEVRPTFKEQLAMFQFLSGFAGIVKFPYVASAVSLTCAAASCTGMLGDVGPVTSASVGLAATLTYSGVSIPMMHVMGINRDRLMVGNLMAALKNHPDQDIVLVLAGSAHIKGMARRLEDTGHFERKYLVLNPEYTWQNYVRPK